MVSLQKWLAQFCCTKKIQELSELNTFKPRKWQYPSYDWSDKGFKSTVVNRALTSALNVGSLKLSLQFLEQEQVYKILFKGVNLIYQSTFKVCVLSSCMFWWIFCYILMRILIHGAKLLKIQWICILWSENFADAESDYMWIQKIRILCTSCVLLCTLYIPT